MKKDIFIDTNIACRFSNPMDQEMIKLLDWLINTRQDADAAYLVVSQKLLNEYYSSCRGAKSDTSIPVLIDSLLKDGRLIKITKAQIEEFQEKHYTKAIVKRLRANNEDRNHIPVVLLSDRKYALTNDQSFAYDLEHFPGYSVLVSSRPEEIPYSS